MKLLKLIFIFCLYLIIQHLLHLSTNVNSNKSKKIAEMLERRMEYPKNLNSNKTKIIAAIFVTKKLYIEILLNYIKNLTFHQKLYETHFWLFTENDEDREYLKEIGNIHKTSKHFSDYQEIFPQIINNEVEISLKGEGNGFIEINNEIEILIDIDNEETKQYLSSKFSKKRIIFIDGVVNNYEYNSIFIKLKKDGKLIIVKDKSLLKSIRTKEKSINSIKIHSGYNKEMFWDYKESKNNGIKLYDTRIRQPSGLYEMYEFYLNYDYEILLKIDDSIVFLDLNRYDDFISYIKNNPDKNFIFPNTINTCYSMFYNNKIGVIPDSLLMDYKYKNHICNIICCRSNVIVDNIHNYFFNNFKKFINNFNEPISLDSHFPSLCFFGVNKKNYIRAFTAIVIDNTEGYNTNYFCNDEIYIINLKDNYLFPNFIVSQYVLSLQRNQGLDEKNYFKYKELSLKYK